MKICLECEGISDTPQDLCASCGGVLSDTSAVHFPLRRGEADAANPLLGAVVDGKYLVQGVLGKGGMGTVYRAVHQVSLIPVALKILNPRFSVRGEYREYFLAEAQKAGRVSHEHAGRILDVGEAEDGTVYIAMEEVKGVTLHECVYGADRLTPAVVVDILEQICQALSAAHHAGLVHRDLSPRNVMVMGRGGRPFVKILDFGIAKGMPLGAQGTVDAEVGAPAGFASPPYSAPEHLEGKDVDSRADLYSLGVLAFEALTRTLPVAGSTPKERAAATIRGAIEPLTPPAGTPPQLARLIRQLLSRDPADRPESANAVLQELHAIRQPASRVLRDVSVLVFVLAVLVCSVAYSKVVTPSLDLREKQSIRLQRSGIEEINPVYLQSEMLDVLTFDFAGFAADDLVARVEQGGRILAEYPLHAEDRGHLLLERSTNTSYDEFLKKVEEACERDAVIITFAIAGGQALGVAGVRIDDVAPELEFAHVSRPGQRMDVLNSNSTLRISCQEAVGLASFDLVCRLPVRTERISLNDRVGGEPIPASELLSELQAAGSFQPVEGVELWLEAKDKAGNANKAVLQGLQGADAVSCDFRLPGVISSSISILRVGDGGEAQLHLSGEERGLTVELAAGSDSIVIGRATSGSTVVDLTFEKPSTLDLSQAGPRSFRLRDPAGNEHEFPLEVTIVTRDPDVETLDRVGMLHVLAPGELVWTGASVEFSFRCNPTLRPAKPKIHGGDRRTDVRAHLTKSELGAASLRLDGVDNLNDSFQLAIDLEPEDPEQDAVPYTWTLDVRCSAPLLHLPDTSARYFDQLVTAGLFAVSGAAANFFGPGAHWDRRFWDARLIRGRIWWSADGVDQSAAIPVATSPDAQLFRVQPRRDGHRALHFYLRDVFEREVTVEIGNRRAEKVAAGPLRGSVKIAEFQDHAAVATVQETSLILEFDRNTRIVFRTSYVFRQEEKPRITFQFGLSPPIPCATLTPTDKGMDIAFDLEWDYMKVVSGKKLPDLQQPGVKFAIEGILSTPAGEKKFAGIDVKSIRSSLQRLTLGEKFTATPALLGRIMMIPVLGPLDHFDDPVKSKPRRDGGFLRREPIRVERLSDFYLQESELTRAQYSAIVRGCLGKLPDKTDSSELWFPKDPMGSRRIREGMKPTTIGNHKDLQRFAAAAPDAPITGVNFYQAYAVARMAGYLIAGDPEAFRLPFGVELELAALGPKPEHLNGVATISVGDLAGGDAVVTPLGTLRGLDFGVREWVMDLPWPVAGEPIERITVSNWLADHDAHVRHATGFATMERITAELRLRLLSVGVVRGVMLDEHKELKDLFDNSRPFDPFAKNRALGTGVPGVVREIHVKRNGEGMRVGRPTAVLSRIGLRLAGGAEFVEKVRSK